jgi:adsorption protein B
MTAFEIMIALIAGARNELLLFASIGLVVGGLDDFILDCIYCVRRVWRAATVYRRYPRMTSNSLPLVVTPGTMAVFIPAWDESAVIGPMLRHSLARWVGDDAHIFVGVYPNDPASIVAVASVAAAHAGRLTMVINPLPGPTTKADCLNGLWRALLRWEGERGASAKAIVLHDAEDVVHGDALRVLSAMIDRFALVQLPVLPLINRHSRFVACHYCDEFAESHAKAMLVREALGAALPSAGVGCAIERGVLGELASARGGRPFDPDSLTEDYELGLRIGELGGRGILVRMRDGQGEQVATREYFPDSIAGAVRQKARWTVGIALAGWDRLGWGNGFFEGWMRLHDRRALLSAVVLAAAYAGLVAMTLVQLAVWAHLASPAPLPAPLPLAMAINAGFLAWRLFMRMLFVNRAYGWREALLSVPRMVVANIIAMMAARRAVVLYIRLLTGGSLSWDKTAHHFPDLSTPGFVSAIRAAP